MKLTLLGGGGTVYIYPDATDPNVAERVAIQRAIIDVAYPADETIVRTIDEAKWPDVRSMLVDDGIEIVDTRQSTCTQCGPGHAGTDGHCERHGKLIDQEGT